VGGERFHLYAAGLVIWHALVQRDSLYEENAFTLATEAGVSLYQATSV